jgi:oligopeptide/dipeptide ABC transporter ATP-binding protein
MKVGRQIAEPLVIHKGLSWADAEKEALAILDRTRIPEARKRAASYPFQFSGGMLQRVMIAIAIACKPQLLIADEPTTALDVTIQDQVLELLRELQRDEGMSIILITHDLGVVARMADEVAVMYGGQIVEQGPVDDIFHNSAHPYTLGLRRAMPGSGNSRLTPIAGVPPDLFSPPPGCAYAARCPLTRKLCHEHLPPLYPVAANHSSRCFLQHPKAPCVRDELPLFQVSHPQEN